MLTVDREIKINRKALDTWGDERQIDKMIEEMAELTVALAHWREPGARGETTEVRLDHVREEMADVQIMLNQMQLLFGSCREWQEKKLHKLARRLGMEE